MPKSSDTQVLVQLNAFSPYRLWSLGESAPDRIDRAFAGKVRVVQSRDRATFLRFLPEANVLFTWTLPRRHFVSARNLRWIHTPEGGAENLLYPELVKSDVLITNSKGVSSDAIADHAFALLLSLSRRLNDCMAAQSHGLWSRDLLWSGESTPVSLAGRSLLVLGLGSIGRGIALRAKSFGMTVLGYRKHAGGSALDFVDQIGSGRDLDRMLLQADAVVLALPLTSETRFILNKERFARTKPGALLINVGRGGLIAENALLESLASGRIAAAGLDVFEQEPLPHGSPLWHHPRVIVTPHVAGTEPRHMDRATELFEKNLSKFLGGEPLENLVDKKAGY